MTDSKYSARHYNILLAQMCRSAAIADLALSQLKGSYFTRPRIEGTIAQGVLFNVIGQHHEAYGNTPDDGTIHTNVSAFIDKHLQGRPTLRANVQRELNQFLGFKQHVDERSEKLVRDVIGYMAQLCVFKPAADKLLIDAQASGEIIGVAEKLYELESKRAAVQGGLSVDSLSGLKLEDIGERVSTNIAWLDSYLGSGAGPVRGCVLGIIAPQGCGKTTSGIQVGTRQALSQRHSLLVLAEEGLTLPMRSKIFASALGIPFPEIQEADATEFDDKLRMAVDKTGINKQLAAKKIASIDEYMHVLDLVKTGGDITSVQGELQTLKLQGKAPIYTYVDWAGIMADRMVASSGRTKESELKTISYSLSRYAQQSNAIIAVSQQMAPACIQKGPFYLNDFTCAADCKGFTEPHKYVLVFNKQDPKTSYQMMIMAKTRDDEARGLCAVVKLRGDIAAFEDISNQWQIAGKRFVRIGKRESGQAKIPSEQKAASGEEIE